MCKRLVCVGAETICSVPLDYPRGVLFGHITQEVIQLYSSMNFFFSFFCLVYRVISFNSMSSENSTLPYLMLKLVSLVVPLLGPL